VSDLLPAIDYIYDIGKSGAQPKRWRDAYLRNLNADGLNSILGGASIATLGVGSGGITSSGDIVATNDGQKDLGILAQAWRDIRQTRYFYSGKVATLPTPSASYRGVFVRVEGGAGESDKAYICMQNSDGTFSWVQIATGA
jgi:hypothetical protein